MSRFLVTGGTGFIGRWVVAGLLEHGHSVRVFDAKPNPAALDEIETGLSDKVEFVTGDISDGTVRSAAQGCDGIVHLAGVMTVDAARDPLRAAEINVIGSVHVFEAAKEHGIDRLVYVSSAAVFGSEDAINPRPMTLYGAHKLAIEGMARAYHLDHGIQSIGFRPFIVYGPGQSSGIAAGPSIALAAAYDGTSAVIQYSGRVGFVHVYDVARYMVAALLSDLEGAEAYTLCGETANMTDFVALLSARMPHSDTMIDGDPLRIPFDLASSPMPEPLHSLPVTGLAAGIEATLAFYRERRTGGGHV